MINTWAIMQKALADRLTYIKPCGEGACSRWTAQQSHSFKQSTGPLRAPAGASSLATCASSLVFLIGKQITEQHARQVALAGVRQDHHDGLALHLRLLGQAHGSSHGRAAGDPAQNPLFL